MSDENKERKSNLRIVNRAIAIWIVAIVVVASCYLLPYIEANKKYAIAMEILERSKERRDTFKETFEELKHAGFARTYGTQMDDGHQIVYFKFGAGSWTEPVVTVREYIIRIEAPNSQTSDWTYSTHLATGSH